MPTLMTVNFVAQSDSGTPFNTFCIVGVKAKLYPVDSADIITRLASKNKDNQGFNKFIRATTREISFWKDTDHPKIGDVVVAYRGSHPVHVALWWGRDKILHAREKTAVKTDRLKTLEKLSTKLRFLTYAGYSHSEDARCSKRDG